MTRETLGTFLLRMLKQTMKPYQSQNQWCKEVGISQAFFNKWTRDEVAMPERYIPIVAKGLGIAADSEDYATLTRLADEAKLRRKKDLGNILKRLEDEAAQREAENAELRALAGVLLTGLREHGYHVPVQAAKIAKRLGL